MAEAAESDLKGQKAGFSFEALPSEQTVRVLRDLGTWSLGRLFTPRKTRGKPLSRDDTEFLANLFAKHARDGGIPWEHPPKIMQGETEADFKHRLWGHTEMRRLTTHHARALPFHFTRLSAQLAWGFPSFQMELQRMARRQLSGQMLLTDDVLLDMRFHEMTVWALITIALSRPRQGIWRRLVDGTQNMFGLPPRLDQLAYRESIHWIEWAGFWEQWLIAEAFIAIDVQRSSTYLRPLLHLPLVMKRLGLVEDEMLQQPPNLLPAPGWESEMPEILAAKYGL